MTCEFLISMDIGVRIVSRKLQHYPDQENMSSRYFLKAKMNRRTKTTAAAFRIKDDECSLCCSTLLLVITSTERPTDRHENVDEDDDDYDYYGKELKNVRSLDIHPLHGHEKRVAASF